MFVEGKLRTVFFLQKLYFTAFIATVEKIITYALGEHDPGSAEDWRMSNDFCSPASSCSNLTILITPTILILITITTMFIVIFMTLIMIILTTSFPIFSMPFSQESLELGLDKDSRSSFDLHIKIVQENC